jgi:hypothetical protein
MDQLGKMTVYQTYANGIVMAPATGIMVRRYQVIIGLLMGNAMPDKPICIEKFDRIEYYSNNGRHKSNGPARVWINTAISSNSWWFNGNRHRYYGPAMLNEWWNHGILLR